MSNSSASVSIFEPLRSIFSEFIAQIQRLNEKLNKLEIQFNEQHQSHTTNLEDSNNRLTTSIVQLTERLDTAMTQIKTVKDENQKLTKAVQLEQQHRQRQQDQLEQLIKNMADFLLSSHEHAHRCNMYQIEIKELKTENEQIKHQIDQHTLDNQTHITALEDTNNCLIIRITEMSNQLKNYNDQSIKLKNENRKQNEQMEQIQRQVHQIENNNKSFRQPHRQDQSEEDANYTNEALEQEIKRQKTNASLSLANQQLTCKDMKIVGNALFENNSVNEIFICFYS
jgi:chromosome segregation ATPase